ncbi:MAG: OadG family protein [Muribaculaceae bacterium]|nr:OadG family protein [Muribaculaceae bacterium]
MKKIFLSAALFLTLAAAPITSRAAGVPENGSAEQTAVENVNVEVVNIEVQPASETPVNENATPTVEESNVARKMSQAEKAHNAQVNDSWGGAITIIAMCIVISALAILSLLFLGFGKISEKLLTRNKRQAVKAANVDHDDHEVDSGEVIAAISMALTEHFKGGHDYEDTILTIRRMKRAYSPWNSKIYNIRQNPTVSRNGFGI